MTAAYLTIFAVVAVAAACWWAFKRRRRKLKSIEQQPREKISRSGDTVAPQTRQRLLQLLYNDQSRVDRLVNHARQNNPGKSEQWCWEKVLYDLEHDQSW
jgi:short-subunit dehydrogenase